MGGGGNKKYGEAYDEYASPFPKNKVAIAIEQPIYLLVSIRRH